MDRQQAIMKRGNIFAALALTLTTVCGPLAFAGECKVKEPTQAAIADALKIGAVFDLRLAGLAKEYRQKYGKEMKVAIVARAGQNMKDIFTLRDVDRRGRLLSVSDIVSYGESQVVMNDAGVREPEKVKTEIKKAYGDKARQSKFSHIGLIFWNHPEAREEDGSKMDIWFFRHMLRPCATAEDIKAGMDPNKPELFDEDTWRFFTDDPYELRAQILVPTPDIQDNLEKMALPRIRRENDKEVMDNGIPKSFNAGVYNAAAGWKNQKEANSNQWVMELIAASTQPFGRVRNRAEAQDVLAKTGYRPMRAMLSGTQAMAGLPFASKIAPYVRLHTDEQPAYVNYAIADLITTLSVEEWMKRNQWIVLEGEVFVADKTKTSEKEKKAAEARRLYPVEGN